MIGASPQDSGRHPRVDASGTPTPVEGVEQQPPEEPEERLFEAETPEDDPYDLSAVKPRISHGRAAFSAGMILAVLFCAVTFRDDFAYCFAGFTPVDLGAVETHFKAGADPGFVHNMHVRFSGLPHYPAFTYSTDGSDPALNPEGTHYRLERFVGTGDRFHVIFREANTTEFNVLTSGPFEGRLVLADRFHDLDAVRDEYVRRFGVTWKPGSYIVLDGDTPQSRWYYWVLGAFILIVIALNGWQLGKWARAVAAERAVTRRFEAAARKAGGGAGD
jgi:hypothetical protein